MSSIFEKDVEHLYEFNLSNYVGNENVVVFDDLMRMICIQFTTQLMFFLSEPTQNRLFDEKFFELLFYILLGIAVYWLVLRKFVKLV